MPNRKAFWDISSSPFCALATETALCFHDFTIFGGFSFRSRVYRVQWASMYYETTNKIHI